MADVSSRKLKATAILVKLASTTIPPGVLPAPAPSSSAEHPAAESTAGYSSAANSVTSPASSTDSESGVRLLPDVGRL